MAASQKWKEIDGLEPFCSNDGQRELLRAIAKHRARGTVQDVADALGFSSDRTVLGKLRRIRKRAEGAGSTPRDETLHFTAIPDVDLPVQQIWDYREKQYAQKDAYEQASKLRPVKVRIDGPIGIHHFGDPHVDDDGTDIVALRRHCKIVRETEGLFGANIGDTTNNWVGRLARLYGDQGTTARQAWLMAEYFLHFCPDDDPVGMTEKQRRELLANWLYLVAGNHDCWSGAGDPLQWVLRQAKAPYEASRVRLNLIFPNGRECRINARHDFKGTSQWNPAHGSMKASQMGFHDHILVNGHKHKSGYGLIKDPAKGTVSHCIQIASYKVHDKFARDSGFPDQHISPSVVTVIDPEASEAGFITVFHDVEQGIDFLGFKRRNV